MNTKRRGKASELAQAAAILVLVLLLSWGLSRTGLGDDPHLTPAQHQAVIHARAREIWTMFGLPLPPANPPPEQHPAKISRP